MTYHVIAIRPERYARIVTLPAGTPRADALRELIHWSTRRASAVTLRDGASGRRVSVEEATTECGLTWIECLQPQQWLARHPACGGCAGKVAA